MYMYYSIIFNLCTLPLRTQKAVTAYISSELFLPFSFAEQYRLVYFQACRHSLRQLGPLMQSEPLNTMFQKHLVDATVLHYGEFMNDLTKVLVSTPPRRLYLLNVIPCAAELFVSIFHSFEAGIADAISSFK